MLQNQSDTGIDSYRERVSKFSSELDLGLIFYIIRRSLWFAIGFFVLCISAAFIYLRYSQPVYQSSAIIQINDNNEATQILQINKFDGGTNKIAEAIEQIHSKIFLKRVVEKSDVQISYFNEGTFKNNELYKSSPYFVKFNIKRNSIYGINIYIHFNDLNSGTLSFNAEGSQHTIPFSTNNVINSDFFDISVSLNTDMDKQQIQSHFNSDNKAYFIIKNVDDVTSELQSKLEIRLLNESAKTILVTVKDINAQKAKDLVNLVTEEYLNFDVERKSESSKSIISFIDGVPTPVDLDPAWLRV